MISTPVMRSRDRISGVFPIAPERHLIVSKGPYNPPTHEQHMARVMRFSVRAGSIFLLFYGLMHILAGIMDRAELEHAGWFRITMHSLEHFGFGSLLLLWAVNLWMFSRSIKQGEPSD